MILGAGGGGADLSVGYTVRSALPSLLGDGHEQLQEQVFEQLPEWTEDSFAGLLMNVAAGRIANRLDFGGTNYTVDAACASSLGAIALGARELQMGTSDMVLAGGVDTIQNPFAYLCFARRRRSRRPAAAVRSTPPPTASRSARASPRSCSSGWPTPSATATASTP